MIEIVLLLFMYMSFWYCISLMQKNFSVVDYAWGLGFILITYFLLFAEQTFSARRLLIVLIITLWGGRLSWHIYLRGRGKGEDPRYTALRNQWGEHAWWRSYFSIFMIQGLCMLIIAYPIIYIMTHASYEINIFDMAGLIIWAVGFLFEVIADHQLKVFLNNPSYKGRVCRTGLWYYSRHPNYFGEALLWLGIAIIAYGAGAGMWAFISPLTITFLLVFVSGIPPAEKMLESLQGFKEYKATTPAFIPNFFKK